MTEECSCRLGLSSNLHFYAMSCQYYISTYLGGSSKVLLQQATFSLAKTADTTTTAEKIQNPAGSIGQRLSMSKTYVLQHKAPRNFGSFSSGHLSFTPGDQEKARRQYGNTDDPATFGHFNSPTTRQYMDDPAMCGLGHLAVCCDTKRGWPPAPGGQRSNPMGSTCAAKWMFHCRAGSYPTGGTPF